MTIHCCPKCEDHPILNDTLECIFCGGRYTWKEKESKAYKKSKEALQRLRERNKGWGRLYSYSEENNSERQRSKK